MLKKKKDKSTIKTVSEEEIEVESSAKVVIVPDPPHAKRPRAPGDHIISVSEALQNGQQKSLQILLCGNSIICTPKDTQRHNSLLIDRFSGSLSILASSKVQIPGPKVELQAYAVLGIITIQSERFLVLASECTCVAVLNSARIYAINRADLIPFAIQPNVFSDKSHVTEIAQLAVGIEKFLSSQGFYFAVGCDLTRPFAETNRGNDSVMNSGDDRFFWNREMCLEFTLLGEEANNWIVPLIHGTVHCDELRLSNAAAGDQDTIKVVLVSRRSRLRASPRDARGLDLDGNCGGFLETEQVLEYGGVMSSYITARGSCPLVWVEKMPGSSTALIDEEATADALKKHIESLLDGGGGEKSRYDSVALLNVVGGPKDEPMAARLEALIKDAGLSAQATAHTVKLEPAVAGKGRALEDLLPALPLDEALAAFVKEATPPDLARG